MESARFDRLSRMFASHHGRRPIIAGLGGIVTGLLSRVAGPEAAEARPTVCRPRGSRCFPDRGLECCRGTTCRNGRCRVQKPKRRPKKCKPTRNRCCRHRDCANNLVCTNRRCRCRAGQKLCHGRCIPNDQCCEGCAEDQVCRNGTCSAARCGHGTPCRVFVTLRRHEGDFGGLDGADRMCQADADDTPALAGGIYRAWLSTSTASPTTRFNHAASSGPFEMLNGAAIANTWADLISGADLLTPFDRVSDGTDIIAVPASNTTPSGTPAGGPDCEGWTSASTTISCRTGRTNVVDSNWTDDATLDCGNSMRLYCFEQR